MLCDEEAAELFDRIDSYVPAKKHRAQVRMSREYPVLFRLIYCCGLRRSEACGLSASQVDPAGGVVTILDAKGNKDRLVYLPEDMARLCAEYSGMMARTYGLGPGGWFFPGSNIKKPVAPGTASRVFSCFWKKTRFAASADKAPTLHSLRHTYVVKRVNLWMGEGLNMDAMMPYLSRHLGHKSVDETYYYYHYVQDSARVVREKDTLAKKVIPEVRPR